MFEEGILRSVNNGLDSLRREVEFLTQFFETHTIAESPLQDGSVALFVDVFINQRTDLTVGVVFHFLTFPVP